MMCGLGFPTQIAKDFEYSAGGLCGKTAPVGGWSNTFPIPFYKSAVVTVRACSANAWFSRSYASHRWWIISVSDSSIESGM